MKGPSQRLARNESERETAAQAGQPVREGEARHRNLRRCWRRDGWNRNGRDPPRSRRLRKATETARRNHPPKASAEGGGAFEKSERFIVARTPGESRQQRRDRSQNRKGERPVSKSQEKTGVDQLTFTLRFPDPRDRKDDRQETEGDRPVASPTAPSPRSKPERKVKGYALYDKVFALPNLEAAWKAVAANQGAAGIDGRTVGKFADNAQTHLLHLSEDLRRKTYRPQPVRRVWIAKSGGGKRPLGIPTVRDRIVHQAVRQILEPIYEGVFSSRSHGFRPERGCSTALAVVDQAIGHGYTWGVDADIASFFDTVDHEKLLTALNQEIADGSVLRLIRYLLKSGVSLPDVGEIDPTELGTPQGGPLSPLLANVYLHAFDKAITQAG